MKQKKVHELEQLNKDLQKENEELKFKLANVSTNLSESAQKLKEDYIQKLINLEEQLSELKRKLNSKSQFSSQKVRGDQTTNGLQNQIARIKAQKVELQRKVKEESVQFRLCNALLEKEILQMKKDARKKEFEMRDLLALNERLKTVSKRKIEEATIATNRLNELLLSRNGFSRKNSGIGKGPKNQRLMRAVEAEVKVPLVGVRSEYVRQVEELAMITKEVAGLKQEAETLKQRNLRCILEDIEVDCKEKDLEIENLVQEVKVDSKQKDLEIKDLKEQIFSLKKIVVQLEQKAEHMQSKTTQNSTPMIPSMESKGSTKCTGSNSELSEVTNTSEAKKPTEISKAKENSTSGICCSCSKQSLCKTTKCKCRSAGGSCGISCCCAPTKCSNREKVLVKVDDSPQSNVTNEKNSSGTNNTETKILAAHGAILLQSALVEKPAETKENLDSRRKPLSDLQNIQIKTNAPKPNRKKRTVKS